jgi:hypothetical protein
MGGSLDGTCDRRPGRCRYPFGERPNWFCGHVAIEGKCGERGVTLEEYEAAADGVYSRTNVYPLGLIKPRHPKSPPQR